jgi:hypothetical protein
VKRIRRTEVTVETDEILISAIATRPSNFVRCVQNPPTCRGGTGRGIDLGCGANDPRLGRERLRSPFANHKRRIAGLPQVIVRKFGIESLVGNGPEQEVR